jgi:hypothetical protein
LLAASRPSTSRKSKSRANAAWAAIASAISSSTEKVSVGAQHLGAAPKDQAWGRAGDRLALGDALDNEVDRRYERPMIEDARVSTLRAIRRGGIHAQNTAVGPGPRCFIFEEAIA